MQMSRRLPRALLASRELNRCGWLFPRYFGKAWTLHSNGLLQRRLQYLAIGKTLATARNLPPRRHGRWSSISLDDKLFSK